MGRLVISLLLVIASSGCAPSFRDTSAYYYSGQPKPSVALLPVVNSAGPQDLGWDLSGEFTDEMTKRLDNSHKLYLVGEAPVESPVAKTVSALPAQVLDKNLLRGVPEAQFLIVTELIEQKTTPYGPAANRPTEKYISESGAILSLAMRVKVIDMREAQPRVVLQEVVETDYNITKPYLYVDYRKHPYGTDFYTRTPLGIAHAKLIKEVVAHIESYVGASN